jgi:hypothetical protein
VRELEGWLNDRDTRVLQYPAPQLINLKLN